MTVDKNIFFSENELFIHSFFKNMLKRKDSDEEICKVYFYFL